jgi:NDP-sugar pyrophosphorylase family protein
MRAMIFAAGLGTRLKPLTDCKPKALVKIAGKSLLEWQLERLIGFGFNKIVINVHHFGALIEDFVVDYLRRCHHRGVEIYISQEYDLLRDTGGGIRHASALLNDGEPFLVHNVDIFSNLNLSEFYNSQIAQMESDSSILASVLVSGRYSNRRMLFNKERRLVGWMNIETNEVKSQFEELKAISYSADCKQLVEQKGLFPYAFGGIHILSPKALEVMLGCEEKFPIVEFYINHAKEYKIMGAVVEELNLLDVGKIEQLPTAEKFIVEHYINDYDKTYR